VGNKGSDEKEEKKIGNPLDSDEMAGSGSDEEESLEFDEELDSSSNMPPSAPVIPAAQEQQVSLRKQLFGSQSGVDLNQVIESLRQTVFQQELAIRELTTHKDQLEKAIADRDVALVAEQLKLASMGESLRMSSSPTSSSIDAARMAELILQLEAAQETIRKLEEEIARLKAAGDDSGRLTAQMDQLRVQTDLEKKVSGGGKKKVLVTDCRKSNFG